jgi:ubiquinone biosynthesis protein UbiJ
VGSATSPRTGSPAPRAVSPAGRARPARAPPAGAAEYWTEESPLIASRVKVEDFVREVGELRDAVERLEKRIERL